METNKSRKEITRDEIIARLERSFGHELMQIYRDPQLIELMRNDDGRFFYEMLGQGKKEYKPSLSASRTKTIIHLIAHLQNEIMSNEKPYIEGTIPIDGARFTGTVSPITGEPSFSLRKKAIAVFTLDQYVNDGVMTIAQRELIREQVEGKKNILVAGGTASGKTTLCNALIHEISTIFPKERLVIIQDSPEIQCVSEDKVEFLSTSSVPMTQLLRLALRYRPDRILVGEVRGAEALDLLDSWNTGHDGGVATIHANSTELTLTRLKQLVTKNQQCPSDIEEIIADSIDCVIYIERNNKTHKRIVTDIIEVRGYDAVNKKYIFNKL